jgi:hypothetical protein
MPIKRKPKAKAEPTNPTAIVDVCRDPAFFGDWFRDEASWANWFVFLKALFGLPMTDSELAAFKQFTGRTTPRPEGYFDASVVVGRRGGKSLCLAAISAWLATFADWSPYLVKGERASIVILAASKDQAGTIFGYLRDMLSVEAFEGLITRETNQLLELGNGVAIEVTTANFRTVRGRTIVAALCDELAFWRNEDDANPDHEIVAALRPAMATVRGARLLKASSPYSRRGVLWDDYSKFYGKDDADTLVWKASTSEMNPSVPQAYIDAAYARDPADASAEYGGNFRSDVDSFVSKDVVDTAVTPGRFELPPLSWETYSAFVDPSGGSADAMTLAIVHREKDNVILDAVREVRPPFSPEAVVSDFAMLLKSYRVRSVTGDKYAGEWPRERFQVHGIEYRPSDKSKSDIYRDLLPLLNGGRISLLDHQKLIAQLCSLERTTARGGKDSIDHPRGAHDDIANAVGGAIVFATVQRGGLVFPGMDQYIAENAASGSTPAPSTGLVFGGVKPERTDHGRHDIQRDPRGGHWGDRYGW